MSACHKDRMRAMLRVANASQSWKNSLARLESDGGLAAHCMLEWAEKELFAASQELSKLADCSD